MEIRVLRYFLETAREGSMTRAAERLHVTQPTLSRQIRDLEEELGKPLFVRHNTSVSLTDEGMILRKRAEDLLSIADKIENEFQTMDEIAGGHISIGCAESYLIGYLAEAIRNLNQKHPGIHYSIISGGTEQVDEKLINGVLDLAFIVEPPDLSRFNYLEVPSSDTWGVLMPKDCPLAEKKSITVDDLLSYPLFISEQSVRADLPRWCGEKAESLHITANFNLVNNMALFVRSGLGLGLTFDRIIELNEKNTLVFRPLYPRLETRMYVIWKKYQVFTPAASLLLSELKAVLTSHSS
ncbi:MAG: LysR family transcriptional regulator [Lachnospiraceae bacterium]|nr:LysR family transcriptional regulator [Lachnospiraceae bacterium]